jgi:hypothetical protein
MAWEKSEMLTKCYWRNMHRTDEFGDLGEYEMMLPNWILKECVDIDRIYLVW